MFDENLISKFTENSFHSECIAIESYTTKYKRYVRTNGYASACSHIYRYTDRQTYIHLWLYQIKIWSIKSKTFHLQHFLSRSTFSWFHLLVILVHANHHRSQLRHPSCFWCMHPVHALVYFNKTSFIYLLTQLYERSTREKNCKIKYGHFFSFALKKIPVNVRLFFPFHIRFTWQW